MKPTFFDKDIQPYCVYCAHGDPSVDGESIICMRFGFMNKNYKCRKFEYSPLKRIPKRKPSLPKMDLEEFKL